MNHPSAAERFNRDTNRVTWHDNAVWSAREKRDGAARIIPEWEKLRDLASDIKANVLANLDEYLQTFEENAQENGIKVHWASDGKEHNDIVYGILREKQVKKLVKSKSMLTEECRLNPFLEDHGIEVIDTDLGERIVQLAKEPPSHIVTPAIHKKKEEIGELFHQKLDTETGATDPVYLTEAARKHLRQQFLTGDASLTGVNFAIAETGGVVVCTNEGNADMGVHLAPLHIASMGIEKIIPRLHHLGVFLRLLARSATGQPITVYSSHYHGPRKNAEMHIVIVDNGRTEQLGREDFRSSLKCIRCGACMNTCPVYRKSGGHSYGSTVPGPIGSILTPGIDLKKYKDLPYASSLCGSCTAVCPVKIDIDEQLYKWRQYVVKEGLLSKRKRFAMKWMGKILSDPSRYRAFSSLGRMAMKFIPGFLTGGWTKHRELPKPPKSSFRSWYLKNKTDGKQK